MGDIEEVVGVLQSLKGEVEVDQRIHEKNAHKLEERMDIEGGERKEIQEDKREVATLNFMEDDEFIKILELPQIPKQLLSPKLIFELVVG